MGATGAELRRVCLSASSRLTRIGADSDFTHQRALQLDGLLDEAVAELGPLQLGQVSIMIEQALFKDISPAATRHIPAEVERHATRLVRVLELAKEDGMPEAEREKLAQRIQERLFVKGL